MFFWSFVYSTVYEFYFFRRKTNPHSHEQRAWTHSQPFLIMQVDNERSEGRSDQTSKMIPRILWVLEWKHFTSDNSANFKE